MTDAPVACKLPETGTASSKDILLLAAWCGLVTGLVEGAALLTFQSLGWLNWDTVVVGVWYEILWISPLFDLSYFILMGLIVLLAVKFIPGKWRLQGSVFLFSFLMFADWALLSGRIRHLGALVLAAGLATALTRWVKHSETSALRFFRGSLPAAFALAVLAFAVIQGGGWLMERWQLANLPRAPAGAPNVLVIVVDTLRADHLSAYGYARATSPHLDRIALQGVLFERAFATSSWTLPSHASLLTGRFPHEHGAIEGFKGSYDGRFPSLAEVLRDRGYRTGAFSANVLNFTRTQGFGQGFHHFEDYFTSFKDMAFRIVFGRVFWKVVLRRMGYDDIPARILARDINGALLRWLDRNPSKPFFAFLNYMDTHSPYVPPQAYRNRFSNLPNAGGKIDGATGSGPVTLTPEQRQNRIDAYDGAIAYVDDEIGKLMDDLEKRGLLENTLVVITSDHGESLGENGLFGHKNALYRNLIHVPLVVYAPSRAPAGIRVETPISNAALPATLLELLGVGEQRIFPGPSLVHLWKNPEVQTDYPFPLAEISQFPFPGMQHSPAYYGAMRSLVSPEWQYILHDKFGTELFSWEKDPQQLNNLAKTPEGQLVVSELEKILQEAKSGSGRAKHLVSPRRVE